MSDILVSIRPKYAALIVAGQKTLEYRRKMPSEYQQVSRMWIYATKPVGKVVAVASVQVVRGRDLMDFGGRSGYLTRKEYNTYFRGELYHYAILIGDLVRFDPPLGLEGLGVRRAPQSWMYLQGEVSE